MRRLARRLMQRQMLSAVPTVDGKAVMGYEMPMLAAVNEAAGAPVAFFCAFDFSAHRRPCCRV